MYTRSLFSIFEQTNKNACDKCFKLCRIECDSINYKIEQNSFQIPNNYSINKLDLNKYVNIFPSLKKWMLKQVKTHIKMHFN